MFILMLASIAIFLITSLPVALYKIASPREGNPVLLLFRIVGIWVGLGWLQSLNYAINFYIHCLSSTLFRKEFKQQIKYMWSRNQSRVSAVDITKSNQHNQTHPISFKY
ncbi:unnamed protein product [Rotaria sp. Silwood1]|nr:unnamed protein product [Rotaria sp. Silwood1]CAF1603454.1 unnamed protein product [Rotaria sp. Silwood1]CAF3715972.1 unnamed protein product [Rotaria sp. Silwood1]CAF4840457.1 unnamed protein product [Rotaria sp. Silwood1]CAF5008862.1 unnamed protein product [Rotaria sp. Silwood1]